MHLLALFDDLDACRAESSTRGKHDILSGILQSENAAVFRDIAEFVHNPYRKAHIKVTDDTLFFATEVLQDFPLYSDAVAWAEFKSLLAQLEQRVITGHLARKKVSSFFARLPPEYHDYFVGIINKDLKIGAGRKIIERHIPFLAPKFEVQLCPSKQWDGRTIPPGGWLVGPKLDGIRGVVGPFGDNPDDKTHGYVALSRNGHALSNTEHVIDELSHVAKRFYDKNDVWPVFDGEFYVHGWELSSSIVSTKKISHPEAHKLQYHVFDIVTHPEWVAGRCKALAHFRDSVLDATLVDTSERIVHVPSMPTEDPEEAQMISQAYVDDGYEGSVLKGRNSLYEFKRSKAWMKYKPFHDIDAMVTKNVYGKLDSAGNMYETHDPRATGSQVVRALVVCINGVETHVGTGLSQAQRVDLAKDPSQVIGKTITVRYQRVSDDGKLIFPRFKGIRFDK